MAALVDSNESDLELEEFARQWVHWHEEREATLAAPHGFLAITNVHWLEDSPQRFADAPGVWSTGDAGVMVDLAEGEELVLEGEIRRGRVNFGVVAERASIFAYWAESAVEVAKRGGHDLIRPRHPDNPLRTSFTGTPAYDPDPSWALSGRFIAYPEPRPVTVGAVVEGLEHVYHATGTVEFARDGEAYALVAFAGRRDDTLSILFTDQTSGDTTYVANRVLWAPLPDDQGQVLVDFNRALNLPCAYTDMATCPLPPPENRLPFAVEAGEKTPRERSDPQAVAQTPRPPVPTS